MERFGVGGTPGLVWADEKGNVQVKAGMPRLSELPSITGLPAQKIDDPELKDFR
jgi:thiol:disulfide interchange protein DsbG